ncbi:histidine phosphatase family protein [Bdellovibrio sp. HCB337]|uniref:histidine phosphatase family protein n=1 Tax=Bdellovibrio sp. HCB337 TaxID=3394358 RepID=UPI0039A44B22
MKVYLFRHGQKNSLPFEDPDLTAFGHQQANKLAELIRNGDLLKGTQFLASPRIRAQSTLRPASALCEASLQVISDLDQRTSYESAEAFRARINQTLNSLEKKFSSHDVVYLCSHHDWIEESLSLIPADTDLLDSRYWSWRPAQYMQFEVVDGLWHLKNFNKVEP